MRYYPELGDICRYDSTTENKTYLVMDVWLEQAPTHTVVCTHLLCLESGQHFEEYEWPLDSDSWHKVA